MRSVAPSALMERPPHPVGDHRVRRGQAQPQGPRAGACASSARRRWRLAFFRLPTLRSTLLTIILPPGENRAKHVREWKLPWSLQPTALSEPGAVLSVEDVRSAAAEPRRHVGWRARGDEVGVGGGRPPARGALARSARAARRNGSFDGDCGRDRARAITTRPASCRRRASRRWTRASAAAAAAAARASAAAWRATRATSRRCCRSGCRWWRRRAPTRRRSTRGRCSGDDYGLLLSDSTQASQAAAQEVLAERVLAGRYWRERLRSAATASSSSSSTGRATSAWRCACSRARR